MLVVLTTHPIQYQVPLWRSLAQAAGREFEVWYLSRAGSGQFRDPEFGRVIDWNLELLEGYRSEELQIRGLGRPGAFFDFVLRERLRDRLARRKVSVLWVQGWQVPAYWQAVREAEAAGVEVWLRGESHEIREPGFWKRPPKRLALKWLFSRVNRFLAIGSANEALYLKYGVARSRISRAPYCVDNAFFRRRAGELRERRSALRSQWSIPEGAHCVLFCGKLIEKKHPMDLVRAVERLRAAPGMRSLHLLFVGTGDLEDELRRHCEVVHDWRGGVNRPEPRHSGSTPASFVGFLSQEEVSRAYVSADCLALPSDARETWGLVANEAIASGLPVVASDQAGCSADLLREMDPGLRFPCGDVDRLAEALRLVLLRPPGAKLLEEAADRHDLKQTVDCALRLLSRRHVRVPLP